MLVVYHSSKLLYTALGCIAYELLTGKHPFEELLPFEPYNHEIMRQRHKHAQPHSLCLLNREVPDHIERAVLQALAKKPSERHTDITAFICSLQAGAPLSSQMPYYFPRTLQTPPPYISELEKAHRPSGPSENVSQLPVGVGACEIVQPEKISRRILHNLSHANSFIPSFLNNEDRGQVKNTDDSLPFIPQPAERSPKTSPSRIRDPIKDLDLRLPKELNDLLSSRLRGTGLVLSNEDVLETIKIEHWQYTAIKNISGKHLVLAYIPHKYLDNGNDKNL
jgi:serine/threonine protein kinase